MFVIQQSSYTKRMCNISICKQPLITKMYCLESSFLKLVLGDHF